MIALLTGRLRCKTIDHLVIDVSGVGYQVQAPLSTYDGLPGVGEEVTLHIHTHVREDSLALFGFLAEAEKDMFLLLMGVSGIGPRLALAVLSSLSISDITHAIQSSDDSTLCTIPGIGKKTAARMVLELKDKINHLSSSIVSSSQTDVRADDIEDAVSALVNLGYKKPLAEEVLKRVRQGRDGLSIEALIREGLSLLRKR
ncbi:MAG: Holliday junction branch migration protein RuvA [Betaproteobacteria bacterium]